MPGRRAKIEPQRTGPVASAPSGRTAPNFWVVAVGASGGDGLEQVIALLEHLPPWIPAAVLVVLHRPPDRPSHLREILARRTQLPVVVAIPGEPLEAGVCYIGEPNRHLAVAEGRTADLTADHIYRGATVDVLFESAARWAAPRVVGVVLAGALADGSAGLAAIKRAGGQAMVVDDGWGEREGMPRAALRAAPQVDAVGSPQQLAAAIVARLSLEPPQPTR